jgi:hypothetical protein
MKPTKDMETMVSKNNRRICETMDIESTDNKGLLYPDNILMLDC